MQTKGAIGNLINRYRAVLKNCHLINVFGSIAVVAMLIAAPGEAAAIEDYKLYEVTNPPQGVVGDSIQNPGGEDEPWGYGIYAGEGGDFDVSDEKPESFTVTVNVENGEGTSHGIYVGNTSGDSINLVLGSFGKVTSEVIVKASDNKDGNTISGRGIYAHGKTNVNIGKIDLYSFVDNKVSKDGTVNYGIYNYGTININGGGVLAESNTINAKISNYGIRNAVNKNFIDSSVTLDAGSVRASATTERGDISNYGIHSEGSATYIRKGYVSAESNAKDAVVKNYGIASFNDKSSVTLDAGSVSASATTERGSITNYGISCSTNGIVNIKEGDVSAESNTTSAKVTNYGIARFNDNSSVTLDAGSVLASAATESGSISNYGIYSKNSGNVTSDDVFVLAKAKSVTGNITNRGIYSTTDSAVEMQRGTISAYAETESGDITSYGIYNFTNSTVNIKEGHVLAESNAKDAVVKNYGIASFNDKSSVTLDVGSVSASATTERGSITNYGISCSTNGIVNIREGDVSAESNTTSAKVTNYGIASFNDNSSVTLDAGSVLTSAKTESGNITSYGIFSSSTGKVASGDVSVKAIAESVTGKITNRGIHSTTDGAVEMQRGTISAYAETESGDIHNSGIYSSNTGEVTSTSGNVSVKAYATTEKGKIENRAIYSLDGGAIDIAGDTIEAFSESRDGEIFTSGISGDGGSSVTMNGGSISVSATSETGHVESYGVYSDDSTINLKNITSITASADAESAKVYSLYAVSRNGGTSTISLSDVSAVVGDMAASSEKAAITASFRDGAYMKGWTHSLGTLDLSFGRNAVWEMVSSNTLTQGNGGKYSGNLTTLALNDSHVYVGNTQQAWASRAGFADNQARMQPTDKPAELEIKNLSGSGHFYLRTDMEKDISDSVLITETLSGSHTLHVRGSGQEPVKTQTASYLARAEQEVGATAGAFALKGDRNVSGVELVDIGLYNYTMDTSERNNGREWYLTRFDNQLSPSGEAEAALSGLAGHYALWWGIQSDLRKRLGEVRYGTQEGLWVRGFADKARLDGLGGIGFTQNLVGGSIGYDKLAAVDEEYMWLVGMQLRSGRAHQRVNGRWGGYGDLTGVGGGLYSTWAHVDGWYVDAVGTIDWFRHNIRTSMLDGTRVNDDRSSYGLGASLEAGRKIDFAFSNEGRDCWFLEPQVQLSYFWVKGGDFTSSNGMAVEQKDMDSLTGRAGLVLGKKFALEGGNGERYVQPYVKAGVNHEFLGEQEARINGVRMTSELDGTRVYYGAGVDWQVSDNIRLYMQAEREHGEHFTREYNVSAGLKWKF